MPKVLASYPGREHVPRRPVSGRELVKFLESHGYKPVDRTGSHVKLIYEDPNTGETRRVTVPQHDELATGTLRSIADQCGANDFQRFLNWIED